MNVDMPETSKTLPIGAVMASIKMPVIKIPSSKEYGRRPYQEDAVKAAMAHIDKPERTYGLITMPTGSGKSLVIAKTVMQGLAKGYQILIITPRRKLLQQLSKTLMNDHGLMSSDLGNENGENHRVLIGTFQTLIKREIICPTLIIIDECHLVPPKSSYSRLLNRFPNAKVVGFTATPTRGVEAIVDLNLGWKLIYDISIVELIKQGYLVPPRSIATNGVVISSGTNYLEITEDIVPTLIKSVQVNNRSKVLVFCANIEHAKTVASLLKSSGESCVFIAHSEQKSALQNEQIRRFEVAKDRSWLINVSLITFGVDIPPVDTVAILRDVSSFSLLVQMIGRGLRLHNAKKECLIYDFGNGTQRFGFIDDPELKKTTRTYAFQAKSCQSCGTLNCLSNHNCTHCNLGKFKVIKNLKSNAESVQLLSKQHNFMTVASYAIKLIDKVFHLTYSFVGHEINAIEYYKADPSHEAKKMIGRQVCVEMANNKLGLI